MPEYIDREAAKRAAHMAFVRRDDALQYSEMIHQLAKIPAADVRPVVKASWIVKEMQALFPGMDEHPVLVCSECGYQIYDLLDNVKERHHFCPNCGADMREE